MSSTSLSSDAAPKPRSPIIFGARLLSEHTYCPERFLDTMLGKLQFKTDAQLARALGVSAPFISNIRHGRIPIGAALLIRMHETSGLTIRELCGLFLPAKLF